MYNTQRDSKELIMNKFCVLGLGMLLCLTGCKDSEKKTLKNLSFETGQKKSTNYAKKGPLNQNFKIDQKGWKLTDAEYWGLTNLETLGMTLDSTTKRQAIDILDSRGYTIALLKQGILEEIDLAGLHGKWLEKWFAKGLPSNELLGEGIKSFYDKLKKSSVVFAGNIEFQGKWDKLSISDDCKNDFMFFVFDENGKLIIFFKQYPKYMEAKLVMYEVTKGSGVSNMGEKKSTIIFRKDRSFAILGKKDLKATPYFIFAPSIVGKHVDAFNKTVEYLENSEENKELQEKEKEYLKDFEGLPTKEYRKKYEEFRNSEEYKELKNKISSKAKKEYLKNLKESSEK